MSNVAHSHPPHAKDSGIPSVSQESATILPPMMQGDYEPVSVTEEFELKDSCSSPGHCSQDDAADAADADAADADADAADAATAASADDEESQKEIKDSINTPATAQLVPPVSNSCKTRTVVSLKKSKWPKWLRINKESTCHEVYYTSAMPSDVLNRSNGRLEALEPTAVGKSKGSWDVEVPERETWDQKADFLLSIIGFAVDLANVWRFPYLCYRNGGGAFLIPYTLMLIFGALPLFYMELVLGQYNRQGPISVWKICPIFKGVGFCAVLVAFYASFYYNVIIGWSFFFLFASFTSELPWTHCNNTWNSLECWDGYYNQSHPITNDSRESLQTRPTAPSAAMEYFERAVLELHTSNGVDDLGNLRWQLVLCLVLVYCILYMALFKGVKSSGKVVWVTATMPYVVLLILLIRGSILPGAGEGIMYFIKPDLSRLNESQVWVDAAVQIFYSVGAGFGVHLSYASYNTFNNNCYRDCLVTTFVNSFTSMFSGLVIFAYLGYMAHRQSVPIDQVATEGPGLVFQVYPEAIATLPGSQFWAVLFFFMLMTLGMDSSMGGLECVITGLMDEFRSFFNQWKHSRKIFTAMVVFASFLVALVNVTRGGMYMFQWFDTYSAGISLLCSALFEAVAVAWFYGLDRFSEDINEMLGIKPGLYWRICWKFISPGFLVTVIICAVLTKQPLKYAGYVYPAWVEILGWLFGLSSVAAIPIWAIIYLCKTKGPFRQRIALGISPERDHDSIYQHFTDVKRFKLKHWTEV